MVSSDHFPVPFEVRIEVFRHQAAGLSRIRSWNGACDVTIARHCVQVCDLASLPPYCRLYLDPEESAVLVLNLGY